MDKDRYYRQLIIPEIGKKGQEKLAQAKVLIVGVGGLGSPIAIYLTAAGIGTIGLVDSDKVELSNLQRQIIHSTPRIGQEKVNSAQKVLKELNPEVKIIPYIQILNKENVSEIIRGYDLVVAAVDNLSTRYLLNEACIKNGIPLVEGGVFNWDGVVHTIIKGQGPCYYCLYPKKEVPSRVPGVLGPIVGIVGTFEAMEAIKVLLGVGKLLTDRLLLIDGFHSSVTEVKVKINPQCPICQEIKK